MDKHRMQEKIEKILKKANVEIQGSSEDDRIIILIVAFNAGKYIEGLKKISFGFFYEWDKERLIILKPDLYTFDNEDESFRLKVANIINDSISGKIIVQDSDNSLEYAFDRIVPLDKITEKLIESIKIDIVSAVAILVNVLMKENNNEE